MKTISLLIFPYLLLLSSAFSEVVRYDNNYQGVRAGASSLEDVERLLGKPLEIIKTPNGHNYRFKKVIINISGDSHTLVNTIIIDKDLFYRTETGYKIGDKLPTAPKKNGPSTWFDQKYGITYWLKDAKIERIVLSAKDAH